MPAPVFLRRTVRQKEMGQYTGKGLATQAPKEVEAEAGAVYVHLRRKLSALMMNNTPCYGIHLAHKVVRICAHTPIDR